MKHLKTLVVLALAFAFAAPAYAKTQNVKVNGSIDMYGFYRSNFDLQKGNDAGVIPLSANGATVTPQGASHTGSTVYRSDADTYLMSITQVGVNADLTDNVSTVINLINQRDWNANAFGSNAPALAEGVNNLGNEFDITLDLAYVQMKEIFYAPLTMTVGRQDLVFGRGFILGWNPQNPQGSIEATEFTQIQSFDAIRATLDFNPWTIDVVYSKIAENNHNPEDDRDMWFTNVNYKFSEYNAVAEGYFMADLDRGTLATAGSGTENNTTYTFGGRAQFDPISQMTLGAELAYQGGHYMIAVTNPRERDRDAWAADLFGEYRFESEWKPMVGVEFVHLSGEDDLSTQSLQSYGSWNGAFRLPVYGWIHDYLEVYYQTAQTSDQAAGQNQNQISLYGSINPMKDLKLTASYWNFWADKTMHTTPGNPGSPGLSKSMGSEIDTALTYAYTEDVTFTFMANWFIPGNMYVSPTDATASEYVSEVKVVF
ncbi:MAG: alginate export family protein [Candidatus Omnitrophica bacterium]|nr:alginate export family protein [Candidatus Omnitrophota bacterium]